MSDILLSGCVVMQSPLTLKALVNGFVPLAVT